MKHFSEAGIALVPRSIGSCIDMAFRFAGREWFTVGLVTCLCALPAAAITYAGALSTEYGWLLALLMVAWWSVPLGSLLVAHASAIAFQETLSFWGLFRRAWWEAAPVLVAKCCVRVPVVALSWLVIPSLMLLTNSGFQTESRLLQRFRAHRHEHQTRDLVKRAYSDLFLRMGLLTIFGVMLWVVFTLTADATCQLLFEVSPIFGPISAAGADPWGYMDPLEIMEQMAIAAVTDSSVLSTLVITTLSTYTILRLAWFFTYVDLRIREDCWDLEEALQAEAQRWEARA